MVLLINVMQLYMSISTVLPAANETNVASLILKHFKLLGEKERVN